MSFSESAILLSAFVLALIAIRYTPFFSRLGCHCKWVMLIFSIKVAAGFAYGWLMTQLPDHTHHADTWRYHLASLQETEWLKTNAKAWLADLYMPRYLDDRGFLATENSLLNDLKEVVFVKFLSVINLFTQGGYAANVVVFNYLCLFGLVALARVCLALFTHAKPVFVLAFVSLMPSVLLWNSGLHRDGLLLHALGMVTYSLFQAVKNRRLGAWQWTSLLAHLPLAFLLRGYALLLLLAGFAIGLMVLFGRKRPLVWVAAILALVALLLLPGYFSDHWHLPSLLYQRQQSFASLAGQSALPGLLKAPTWSACAAAFPYALTRVFFTPPAGLPAFRTQDLLFVLENLFLVLLILITLVQITRHWLTREQKSALLSVLFFFLAIALLAAFTVPFATALVRYRSVALPFIVPLLAILWLSKGIETKAPDVHISKK